jgi:hypothetical protein
MRTTITSLVCEVGVNWPDNPRQLKHAACTSLYRARTTEWEGIVNWLADKYAEKKQ